MKRIEMTAEKFSNRKWILIFFSGVVLAEILFVAFLTPAFLKVSGGQNFLDLQTAFTAEDAENLISVMGDEGQKIYDQMQVVDLFFPFFYGMAFCLILSSLLIKLYPQNPEKRWPLRFPLLGAAFDLTENLGILILRKSYPPVSAFWANFSSIAGVMKMLFLVLTLVSFALLLTRVFIQNHKKKGA